MSPKASIYYSCLLFIIKWQHAWHLLKHSERQTSYCNRYQLKREKSIRLKLQLKLGWRSEFKNTESLCFCAIFLSYMWIFNADFFFIWSFCNCVLFNLWMKSIAGKQSEMPEGMGSMIKRWIAWIRKIQKDSIFPASELVFLEAVTSFSESCPWLMAMKFEASKTSILVFRTVVFRILFVKSNNRKRVGDFSWNTR